jgi:phosphoribosylformylglycinamidine synthase
MPRIAVVIFPGSNCDRDVRHVLREVCGADVVEHWHTEPVSPDYAAVVLPGGFAYGDYLRVGALAKISPAVESLAAYIAGGKPVLGICNGFQILVEAGYLPGALAKNQSLQFQCEDVFVRVESDRPPFLAGLKRGSVHRWMISHSEGRYVADEATIRDLERHGQIALRYCGPAGELEPRYNANGSTLAIAGITNREGNVLGFMPHPERGSEAVLGNDEGLAFFRSMMTRL